MDATQVLDALTARYTGAAIVPEISISDPFAVAFNRDVRPELSGQLRQPEMRRIDALMFEGLQRTAIEIKVSVADASRESYGKTGPWNRVVHRFVYVTPAGLINRSPVYGAGLWWVHDDGSVEVVRKATINRYPEHLPQHVIQTLAYRACGRTTIQPLVTTHGQLVES